MKRADPPIELEPKSPFSWKVVICLLVAWVAALVMVIELRSPMLRILMPLIGVILVVYLTVCTIVSLKNRK